ncbi:uncharacterized protein [Phyllobates terribilis]|uniref:uncharacterized protein isoform X2 n=1 Tax=Phyllobates terribilis TaxID=111132 RepID=UPI003CCA868F
MRGFLIIVLLILTMDVTSGQISIQPIPQYPVINGSVTLSLTGITDKIEAVIWYKGPNRSPQYEILVYVPGINRTLVGRPLYNDRISVFNNGSLHIKDLRLTDGGNYKVTAPTLTSANNVDVTLTVYGYTEPINNSTGLIIGLTIGTILGGVLIIIISVFLCKKILTKKNNGHRVGMCCRRPEKMDVCRDELWMRKVIMESGQDEEERERLRRQYYLYYTWM